MRAAWLGALGVLAAGAAAWWLPSCSDNSCQGANCASNDSGPAPTISGGGCDTGKPPSQGGCAVADSDGFFVSPTGSDSADGSKATPFQTIAKGITAATGAPSRPNVYICAGTYAENLTIQGAPQGIALHGGFSCTDWSTSGGTSAVAPAYVTGSTTPQYVLRVLGTAALVEALTLTAPDATDPGVSSVAVFVDTSPGMTFRRATVTAGKGADGASPAQTAPLAANKAGNNANQLVAGAEQKCNCTSDFSVGGAGGYYDAGAVNAQPGLPFINGIDAGAVTYCNGGNGANGIDQAAANSTNVLGELTSNGWTASPGGPGATGGTAQGGGGGNWNQGNGFGGSSGGCGGCGGSGGAGGGAGGGSIAIGVLNTTLRVQASTLHGGTAGNGGNGAVGQLGQPGGAGGSTNCAGGAGGTGGAGGGGGGGAGGVSLGIAAVNTTPDIDAQSSVLGGKAGAGGNNGAVPPSSKATDGLAEAFHTF